MHMDTWSALLERTFPEHAAECRIMRMEPLRALLELRNTPERCQESEEVYGRLRRALLKALVRYKLILLPVMSPIGEGCAHLTLLVFELSAERWAVRYYDSKEPMNTPCAEAAKTLVESSSELVTSKGKPPIEVPEPWPCRDHVAIQHGEDCVLHMMHYCEEEIRYFAGGDQAVKMTTVTHY